MPCELEVVPGGTLNFGGVIILGTIYILGHDYWPFRCFFKSRDCITHDLKLKNLRSIISVLHTTSLILKQSCFHKVFNMEKKATTWYFCQVHV